MSVNQFRIAVARQGAVRKVGWGAKLSVICFLLFSIVLFIRGLEIGFLAWGLSRQGQLVEAKVVRLAFRGTGKNGRPFYDVIAQYQPQSSGLRETQIKSNLQVGDSIQLLYNPTAPDIAMENSWEGLWQEPLVCLFLSLFIGASACYFLNTQRKEEAKLQALMKNGERVLARALELNVEYRDRWNRPFYSLLCLYIDPRSGEEHLFLSSPRPDRLHEHLIGSEVTVLVEPSNLANYYVDLE